MPGVRSVLSAKILAAGGDASSPASPALPGQAGHYLTATYAPPQLVDADDLEHLIPAEHCLLTVSLTSSSRPQRRAPVAALSAGQANTEVVVLAVASGWETVAQLFDILTMQLMTHPTRL